MREAPASGGGAPRALMKCRPMPESPRCPKCGCDDRSMIEATPKSTLFCNICAHEWGEHSPNAGISEADGQHFSALAGPRPPLALARRLRAALGPQALRSIDDLIARTGLRRDELATLAEIGALNAFGHDRRSALWQIERAVRSSGEMFRAGRGGGGRAVVPLARHDAGRARAGGLRRDEPDHRAASDGALPRRAGAARRAARERSRGWPLGPPRAGRRRRHHAAAARHRQGIRVPHPRGRDRHRQHHRPSRSLHRRAG